MHQLCTMRNVRRSEVGTVVFCIVGHGSMSVVFGTQRSSTNACNPLFGVLLLLVLYRHELVPGIV